MKKEIKIPSMGESVAEATISNIIKPSGSSVRADEEILELETDKVNQLLYAPDSGVLNLTVSVGQKVKIGDVIGYVDTEGKAPAAEAPKPAPKAAEPTKPSEGTSARGMAQDFVSGLQAPSPTPPPRPAAPAPTPAAPTPAAPAPEEKPKRLIIEEGKATRKRMSNLRKVIAQRLVEAKNSTAMLTTFNEIDMSANHGHSHA